MLKRLLSQPVDGGVFSMINHLNSVVPGLLLVLSCCVTNTSTETSSCGITLTPGCTCRQETDAVINVSCYRLGLATLPNFDFGPKPIHTLNLEGNKLNVVNTGDFFGLKIERLLLGNNSISELNLLAFWGLESTLQYLDLSHNRLHRVPADALRLLVSLKSLSLTGNRIVVIFNHDFQHLQKLEILSLDENPIATIQDDAFVGTSLFLLILDHINLTRSLESLPTKDLSDLKGLSLSKNRIENIPPGFFLGLPSLKFLCLDDNRLRDISPETFIGVDASLTTLEINGNKLKKIPKRALRNLISLETLELSRNRIKKIYSRSFNASQSLLTLDLSHNNIRELSPHGLAGLDNIEKIDLRYNKLITLDERTFYWEPGHMRQVLLIENPWLCNCLLKWLRRDFRQRTERMHLFPDLTLLRCDRPEFLAGRPLTRVPLRELSCDHDYYYYYEYP